MTTFDCQLLVEQYSEWIREGLNVEEKNGSCVITSPFLDRHHDYLQIYVQQSETGYSLSDDGYTLRDLKISGLEINTERRTEALHNAIRPFGIQLSGDELQIAADTISDFPQKKHDLIQAMLAVGDLIHLAQATVTIVFKEDVGRYLRAQGVQFVPDVRLTGTSGFHHPFDFVVGQTTNNPERYVRAINTPTREHLVEVMFAWQDVQTIRAPNAKMFAILNDEEHRISSDNLAALDKYGVEVMRWSKRAEGAVEALRN